MKKLLVVITNIVLMFGILLFVFFYSRSKNQTAVKTRTDDFESMTVSIEQITTSYIQSEQNICDSWANYINKKGMTIQEAIEFVRMTQVVPRISSHIIYIDDGSYSGISSHAKNTDETDFTVSYQNISIFQNVAAIDNSASIRITRSYTNPMTGVQSIAFYKKITLLEDEKKRDAVLLRVVPILLLEQKWVFPTEEFKDAQVSLIERSGNYIIRGNSFKNTNFFEFYKSYNDTNAYALVQFEGEITSSVGVARMRDSKGIECLVSHAPMDYADNLVIVSMLEVENLNAVSVDWFLVGFTFVGLLLLLAFDMLVFMYFNRQLAKAAVAADAANQAKTSFLSTMSHDIRTPMNAIIGLTAIAEKNADDSVSVRDNLKKISLASNHLLTLINDILDISKVESGKFSLSPHTFSIVDTAENLVNISQPLVRQNNIDFRFRIKDIAHENLFADQLRINQIFINILSNALKYTPENKSVYVDMREEPTDREDFTRLVFVVRDKGIGMTEDFMKKMYQPFSRETDSRINTVQGTGLGLAITRKMVELMDGTIECESKVGEGTTFKVSLDIQIADTPVSEMVLPPIDILLIDDDETLLETAHDALVSLGAKADISKNGTDALARVMQKQQQNKNYSVIILDWKMPGMDGVELTHRIREVVGRDIPILLVSAYDWSQIEQDAKNAGVSGFISKPLFKSSLYAKITEVLNIDNKLEAQEENDDDIAGTNVLVAEDMDVNWEIVQTLLEMHGINAERAENGQVAVEKIRSAEDGKYDVVFMDIQMPVMNGLDATRTIRKLEGDYAKSVPIIAMTADAFSENVTECLAAGMNGHIAKPIDIKHVLKEIRNIRRKK